MTPWWERAACAGRDTEIFGATTKAGQAVAKAFCRRCPVIEQCLADALRFEGDRKASGRYYVVGGLTPQERAQRARESPRDKREGDPEILERAG